MYCVCVFNLFVLILVHELLVYPNIRGDIFIFVLILMHVLCICLLISFLYLDLIPIYYLPIFRMAVLVSKNVERLMRIFCGNVRRVWRGFPLFSQFVKCFIGDNSITYFLEDSWVDERPLCALFPHLYHFSNKRMHSVGFW